MVKFPVVAQPMSNGIVRIFVKISSLFLPMSGKVTILENLDSSLPKNLADCSNPDC